MFYSSGDVIEFFDSGTLKLGLITGENKNRFQVYDQNCRQRSVSVKQVAITHALKTERAAFPAQAKDLSSKIESLKQEIDSELLWESVNTEARVSLLTLAKIYFGESDPLKESAILRALLGDSLRFKWRVDCFHPRTEEQVEAQIHAETKHRERLEMRSRAIEWMRQIIQSEGETEPPSAELEEVLQRIEKFLLLNQKDSIIEWLSEVDRDLTPKAVAFDVLAASGRLPKEADPFLIATGIDPRFPDEVLEAANQLDPFIATSIRSDFTQQAVFSIDDEDTREIDDALSVTADQDKVTVGVHIADLTSFVVKNSVLDQEAARRSTSIYLPHHTIRMFPDRISCDLASLRENELRSTLSFLVDFNYEGEILNWKLSPGQVKVSSRLTYDEADQRIADNKKEPLTQALLTLEKLAGHLSTDRKKRGALVINRPELKITVRDGDVSIKVLDPASPSRQIISEFMILSNRLAAEYAVENSVPLIFRCQPKPKEELISPEGYDPVLLNKIFSKLEPSRLSLTPQPHFALGLDSYIQLTSPIRRFTDLTLQRQITAHLAKQDLPYNQNEMMEVLGSIQALERDIKSVERKANRQFTLQYLAKHYNEMILPATVIRELPRGYLVETDQLYVRGRLATEKEFKPGERMEVKIERIYPEKNVLVFSLV